MRCTRHNVWSTLWRFCRWAPQDRAGSTCRLKPEMRVSASPGPRPPEAAVDEFFEPMNVSVSRVFSNSETASTKRCAEVGNMFRNRTSRRVWVQDVFRWRFHERTSPFAGRLDAISQAGRGGSFGNNAYQFSSGSFCKGASVRIASVGTHAISSAMSDVRRFRSKRLIVELDFPLETVPKHM